MAGKGPPPSKTRRRSNEPERGEWQPAPGYGWQHGKLPSTPIGLLPATRRAWRTWFRSWFASHWMPEDLPGLRLVIQLYDTVLRGELQHAAQLRIAMDTYGITPKGQQDRRWAPPKEEPGSIETPAPPPDGPYGHLRALPTSS